MMQLADADASQVRAAQRGDSAAFGLLLERHYPALLRVCLQLVRDRALAEDCAQDAAIVAWLRLSHLRSPEAFSAWLIGIGRHTCQHALRARPPEAMVDLSSTGADSAAQEFAVEADMGNVLRQAIDELPPACRSAVCAFYLGGLDYTEAAKKLGISLSALKVRLHSARGMLRYRFRLREPAIRKPPRTLRTLAIHEAAHAVLFCRYGTELQRVSIAPVSAVWVAPAPNGTGGARQLPALLRLQVLMAGEMATMLAHSGKSGGDRDAAGAIALRETGGDRVEAALLLDHARRSACLLLESSRIWRQVERVAGALVDVRTVDGQDLRALCSRAA